MVLPPAAETVSFLGVDYARVKTADGGDLYLTRFGLCFHEHLASENWYAPDWFVKQRIPLEGTSTIYKLPTKPVRGHVLDLVVRFSRLGQEIPLSMQFISENAHAEFNSPFEEFALVMTLRSAHLGTRRPRLFTQKPLAIYVPATQLQDWQTGRLESKMAAKRARHPEVKLEMSRQYILLYGWIDGLNAVQAAHALGMAKTATRRFLRDITLRVIHDLRQHGFRVLDIKAEHVVVRIRPDGMLLHRSSGDLAYALVDYELLERLGPSSSQSDKNTPAHKNNCIPT
jgi:hypothetical protein